MRLRLTMAGEVAIPQQTYMWLKKDGIEFMGFLIMTIARFISLSHETYTMFDSPMQQSR